MSVSVNLLIFTFRLHIVSVMAKQPKIYSGRPCRSDRALTKFRFHAWASGQVVTARTYLARYCLWLQCVTEFTHRYHPLHCVSLNKQEVGKAKIHPAHLSLVLGYEEQGRGGEVIGLRNLSNSTNSPICKDLVRCS